MSRIVSVIILIFLSSFVTAETIPLTMMQKEAETALIENDYYHSIAVFMEILEKNPSYFDARLGISEAYLLLEEYEEALGHILKAISLDKSSIDAKIIYGRILTGQGEYAEARALYMIILEKELNNMSALLSLAELEVAEGNILTALDLYKNALAKSPGDRRALISSIILFDSINKIEISETYVDQVLILYPENAYVNYIAAKHFYESDNINTALEYAARSFDIDSENPDTIFLLSLIYISMEKYDRAVVLIENSLNITRSNSEIWYLLGEVYLKLGNIDKSIYCYATAIRYSSQYELPRIALENTIIENKSIDDPVRSKYADYHFFRGVEFIDRNYSIQARNEFRRGLLIDPHSNKGKELYAGLIKTEGYLNKYLSLLKSIATEKPDDMNLADEVEIYQSIISATVSEEWDIDQFIIDVPKYNIELFLDKASIAYNTYNEGFHLGSYLIHILHGFENIESNFNIIPSDFSNAFKTARENGSDYFIMFSFKDTKRSFSANAGIYHSGTGSLLREIPVFKTGNQKISLSLQTLSRTLSESLPVWSEIIERKFNRVLLNVGNIQGTTPGDIFLVIRKGDFNLKKDSLGLDFNPELLLGEVEITKTDDLVSEGTLKKYHFFDLINPGDYLIKKNESMDLSENDKNLINQNLPVDLYKSIISIP